MRLVIGNGAAKAIDDGLASLISRAIATRNKFLAGGDDSIDAMASSCISRTSAAPAKACGDRQDERFDRICWLGRRAGHYARRKLLTDDERKWFRQIVQRIAALLALGADLNALYQEAASSAFTAAELDNPR